MIFLIERKKKRGDKNNMVNISIKKPIQLRLKLFKQRSNIWFFAKKYSTSITIGYWNKLITFHKMTLNCLSSTPKCVDPALDSRKGFVDSIWYVIYGLDTCKGR